MGAEIGSNLRKKRRITWRTENLTGGSFDHRETLFLPDKRGKRAGRKERSKKRREKARKKGKHMGKGVRTEDHDGRRQKAEGRRQRAEGRGRSREEDARPVYMVCLERKG